MKPILISLLAAGLSLVPNALWSEERAEKAFARPVLIRLSGPIDAWFESYTQRKLAKANSLGCDLLILEIDSPGGGLAEMTELCNKIVGLANMRTVAFVPHEALSAAAILSLACDEIVVSSRARIGDCGPIYLAEDFMFRHAPEKIRSDLVARVRIWAEQKKHPAALAEAMVDMNCKVELLRSPTGETKLVTHRELQGDHIDVNKWQRVETLPESGESRFLELSGVRAKDLGLAIAIAETREDLFKRYNLTQPPIVLEPNTLDTTVGILNHWLVTALILLVGLVALGVEVSSPGIGFGALIAGLCFVLFFWSRFLGGTSGWLEVVLFASGVVFLGVELFVIPGFGITGFTGIGLMLAAVVLASQDFLLPHTNAQLVQTSTSLLTVLGAGAVCLVVAALAVRHSESLPFFDRLMLRPPVVRDDESNADPKDAVAKASEAAPVQVGDWGLAATALRPGGKAEFGEAMLDVVADGLFVQPGTAIRIVEISGNRIVVTLADGNL